MPWVAVKMGQPKAALLKKGTKSHTKHTADEMPHGHHPEDRMKKGEKPPFFHTSEAHDFEDFGPNLRSSTRIGKGNERTLPVMEKIGRV